MHVMLPRGTDIRDLKAAGGGDLVEVPSGSGRFYNIAFVDDIGLGFPNEHRFAMAVGIPTWPIPFPVGHPGPPPPPVPLASGGSLGLIVAQVIGNFVAPGPGTIVVSVAMYASTVGGTAVTINGLPPTNVTGQAGTIGVAPPSLISQWSFLVAAGPMVLIVANVFPGVSAIQWQAVFLPLNTGVIDGINTAAAGGVPAVGTPLGQAVAVETAVANFSLVGSVGPFGYGAGFVSAGLDVTDVIVGVVCTLSAGMLPITAIGNYPTGLPLAFSMGFASWNTEYF